MGPFWFIGFTATKTSSQTYTTDDTITFDEVLLSRGNHFDPSSSTFLCPYLGTYYVTVNAIRRGGSPLNIDVKHGQTVVFRLKDTSTRNPGNAISNGVLVRCYPGDSIKVTGAGDGEVYGDRMFIVTTFTVMLVNKE